MPSTNKLSSRIRGNSLLGPRRHIARFLYTFCGIFASFGVVTKALVAVIVFLATFAIPVSMAVLGSNNASAVGNSNTSNSSSNTVSATLPGSVAIRLLDSTATTEISSLDFNLTPTTSGTSATQSMVVDVATSNPTGYKLYMQSDYQTKDSQGTPTGNYTTNLTHTDADVTDNIPTSTTSGSKVYWNYINPLTNSGSSNPTPSVIPPYGTPDKIAQYFSPTNSHQSTIDINVGIDTTIVSGTYENQLLFSAVGNPETVEYTITFNPDGGTQTTTTLTETAAAGTHAITIPNTSDYIPTKSSYVFDYWQIIIPTGSQVTATCNNTNICHPGDNIIITSDEEFRGDVTLKANYKQDITTIDKMQDVTAEICENTPIGASATLQDTRDSNTYTVRRLADGNCWMTQNLRLKGRSVAFTPEDTQVGSNFIMTTAAENTGAWCMTADATCYNKLQYIDTGDTTRGVFYNWYTATAGTGKYETGNNEIASYSICPKGWRLPTSSTNGGEFTALDLAWGGTGTRRYNGANTWYNFTGLDNDAYHGAFPLAGRHDNSGSEHEGEVGYFWASIAGDNNWAHDLMLGMGNANQWVQPWSDNSHLKSYGFSVRCLAKDMSGTLTIDPKGGTWGGSSESQSFTQSSGSTKDIVDPIGPSYTISFDDNNYSATFDSSTISVTRKFNRWVPSGFGFVTYDEENGNKYNFGTGSGTIVAEYGSISDKFNLPTITKSGYTCDWTANGNTYASGQEEITVTENTTFTANCTSPAFSNITKMQEMTPEICASNAIGTSKTLTDTRDNKTYAIKRLNDGNCWMTQNLRLAGGIELNSNNSDVAETFTLPSSTSDNFNVYDEFRIWDSNNTDYGVYYNWYTATAKSGARGTNEKANYSICAKGWKLPTGGPASELQTLGRYYPVTEEYNKMVAGDPAFNFSGWRSYTSMGAQGSNGYYWSSIVSGDPNRAYNSAVSNTDFNPSNTSYKHLGLPIRCLVKSTTSSILIVDPNGGTWNGSTETQSFTQNSGTTKTISNPTTNPISYNITFDDNGQNAVYDTSLSSVSTKFNGWAFSGDGSFAGGSYSFGIGKGTLVAQYGLPGEESESFVLPSISKNGHVCKWAEIEPYGIQFGGGTSRTITKNTTYYAVCTSNNFNITNMQQMTPTICTNASVGDSATLVDTRDDNVYSIQKLKDGNCWMTQNLRLVGPRTLTSSDSNVTSNYTLPASTAESDDGTTAGINKWCWNDTESCGDRSVVLLDTETKPYNNTFGAYYNWHTATAGTGSYSTTTGNAPSSICPKGWRLPTGSDNGEFNTLYKLYQSSYTLMLDPAFIFSGSHSLTTSGRGVNGEWWPSTTDDLNDAKYFRIDSTTVVPAPSNRSGFKMKGLSVRCIAEGYPINISNSNTSTFNISNLQIPYGGSAKIDVKPNSNYYLSNVNCPSGYTCSGYTTGISATDTQTVTITNNGGTSGGTVTFTGSPNLQQSCANTATGSTFTYNNVQYIKLKTNSAGTTTACYTKSSQGTATYANAASKCPSGTSVPTQTDFSNLTTAYGTSSALNTATGWGPSTSYTRYWSSTTYSTTNAYYLRVRTSSASVTTYAMTNSINVICKVN